MSLVALVVIGALLLIALVVFVAVVIAHYPSDNSF
jgi:hypothetical protein